MYEELDEHNTENWFDITVVVNDRENHSSFIHKSTMQRMFVSIFSALIYFIQDSNAFVEFMAVTHLGFTKLVNMIIATFTKELIHFSSCLASVKG